MHEKRSECSMNSAARRRLIEFRFCQLSGLNASPTISRRSCCTFRFLSSACALEQLERNEPLKSQQGRDGESIVDSLE
jgi:hypothetical protein